MKFGADVRQGVKWEVTERLLTAKQPGSLIDLTLDDGALVNLIRGAGHINLLLITEHGPGWREYPRTPSMTALTRYTQRMSAGSKFFRS